MFTRNVSQAYTQSDFALSRPIYSRPPSEMQLPDGCVLKVLRPLYGLPEAGVHRFQTHQKHHIAVLNMRPAAHDSCFLVSSSPFGVNRASSDNEPFGIVCMQVDDTLDAGNSTFVAMEERESRKFKSKQTMFLSDMQLLRFNSATISTKGGVTTLTQDANIARLEAIAEKDVDYRQYISHELAVHTSRQCAAQTYRFVSLF